LAVVLDTSVVVAAISRDDRHHAAAARWLEEVDDELVTSPLAVAEMDYWASKLGGLDLCRALWDDFDSGAYAVRWWADALSETMAAARAEPHVGLTDASLVALAARLRTTRIATFDLLHFRALSTPDGEPFIVLPADAT
jgi:predicted nucleic acid-binding protein